MTMLAGAASAQAAIHIDAPADEAYTNDLTPDVTFSGAVADGGVTLEVFSDLAGATIAGSNGAGTITPSQDIADGPRERIGLTVRDADGLDTVVVNVNWVPGLSGPGDDTTQAAADIVYDVSEAIPGRAVRLYANGALVATRTADGTGSVSDMAPDSALSPGAYTLSFKSVDAAGVESSGDEISLDVAPDAPTYGQLFDLAQLNDTLPAVTVENADPTADAVTLYKINGEGDLDEVGHTAGVNPDGTATITPTAPLADDFYSLVLTQTVEGIESIDTSSVLNVTVNTSAPALESGLDGELTNTSPWFYVTGALQNLADNHTSVNLYIDGVYAGSDGGDGGGSAGIHPEGIADGTHTAYVVTVDDLGHVSAVRSNEVRFTLDATAPDAPTPVSPQDGAVVTSATPQVVVHTEPGARVHLLIDDTQDEGFVTADADGNGAFTLSAALADGAHMSYVFATDAAGNDSDIGIAAFTVKTTPPTPPPPTPTPPPTPPTVPTVPTTTTVATTPIAPSRVTLSSHTLTKDKPVKLGFTLSKPGTIKVTITIVSKGRTKTVASVDVKVKKGGKGSYTLRTKVGNKTLKKGTYKVTLQTVNGKKKSEAVTQKLTVG